MLNFINPYHKFKEDRDRLNETNDCTVVSYAVARGISYQEAHKFLHNRCRRGHRRGIYFNSTFSRFCKEEYSKAYDFGGGFLYINTQNGESVFEDGRKLIKAKKMTLKNFASTIGAKGRWIVTVRGHALTIIDGVVYDHTEKPKRYIECAYKIK